MSGVVETVEVDPTQAVGRLLHPEGWRVERTFPYDGGTWLTSARDARGEWAVRKVPHGETVTVVVEPADMDAAPLYGITIQQPYASLIAHGIKTIETRGYQPRVVKPGDDIAIIAGAKRPTPGEDVGDSGWYWEDTAGDPCSLVNWREGRFFGAGSAPLGAVVAVARFVEALPIVANELGSYSTRCLAVEPAAGSLLMVDENGAGLANLTDQLPYGIYEPGRFGWLLDNVRRLPEPIPCTGFQGLRALPDDVATATRQAVR